MIRFVIATLLLATPVCFAADYPSAGRDWGDWAQGRLYVPLVHQMVGYLTERLPENQRVQRALASPEPPGCTIPPVQASALA